MAILFLYNNPIVNEPIGNNIMINFTSAAGSSLNLTFNQFVELKSTNTVGKEMVFEGVSIKNTKVIDISEVEGITWIRKVNDTEVEVGNIKTVNFEVVRNSVIMNKEIVMSMANF